MASIIIPAYQEQDVIGRCIESILQQDIIQARPDEIEAIVIANGCTDETAKVARSMIERSLLSGLKLTVLEIGEGSKPRALNEGDKIAAGSILIYLDADVTCEKALVSQLVQILDCNEARYASGSIKIYRAKSFISRAYGRVWSNLPFNRNNISGCGLYAVNRAGRSRWGIFPTIHSDDKFCRLQFSKLERFQVPACYYWPIPDGFINLLKVRRRWCEGNFELKRKYPDLARSDDSRAVRSLSFLSIIFKQPLDATVFVTIYIFATLLAFTSRKQIAVPWRRGR